MKKILIGITFVVICLHGFSQPPQSFQYQAVVRDASGTALVNQPVNFQISILSGSITGTVVYSETHTASTNAYGIVTLNVGGGTPVTGTFSSINWGSASHYIKVEADPTGGTTYLDMGTTQLLSVPYALYSEQAGNIPVYTGGTGIDVTGTTITNTSPDQTVTLTQGGATTITGTYPNFTISSTDNNTTYSAGTGLGLTGTTFSSTQTLAQTLTNGNSAGSTGINMNNQDITGARILGLGASNANYIDMYYGHIYDYAGSHGISGQVLTVRGTSPNTYVYWENPFIGAVGTGLSLSGNTINSVWTQNGNHIYNNNTGNVGVGITNPAGRMVVQGSGTALPTDPLFEVKNAAGQTVFVVYPDSVHIYVKDTGAKSNKGGFAVSGRNNSKALTHDFLYVDPDFTRVYTGDTLAGFGVQNIGTTADNSYMQMTPKNYFIGHDAGKNTSTGKYNSFIGYQSGFTNIAGNYNVFLGYNSGYYNTASYNLFIGYEAGKNNTTGTYNSFIGYQSGLANTTGNQNAANGFMTFNHNTTGSYNTAIGSYALFNNTIGTDNTAIGNNVLSSNTSGNDNIAVGSSALQYNTTGIQNTAVGAAALRNNVSGNNNSALGYLAGYNATGTGNSFMGYYSGYNSTGSSNVFMGYQAGYSTTGTNDVFIGYQAGLNNTSSNYTTGVGSYALYSNTTGIDNTAIGNNCLSSNTIGNDNIATGSSALQYTTSGSNNTANGAAALRNNTTGNNNTALGYLAFYNGATYSNSTALGANSVITASNQVRLGDNTVGMSIGGFAAWTNLSDGRFKKDIKENVPGLDFITKLRPVTYRFDQDKMDNFLNKPDSLRSKSSENILFTGFIAQEVEKAAKELNFDFSGIDKPKNEKDYYGLRYSEFTVPLVKAVQELNAKNDELQRINQDLLKRIEALEKAMSNKK